ncbi:sulfate anion transporter 1 [Vicugna pacos]|uniref:Sulfate anion transporter 1 n=1 Tax=Vicugna pacos TaxID=30538 RepID=A0A6J3B832_VICPA|nr:sulfate anion transporter 1 [Vicugna pacos]XP_015102302.1 sulfate anion transporter 1 [Vicugna pacos]XP_031540833.1 sulfate anion transporter 1 [Vicugna pacos]XP_031540838.1 sulfate anion transporter 1 [Vicugna pacos]XP_031540841.1 sulfate anion transporter 1 [Vicugna pacos]XP_031540845.1 sulfate anion transporter 1 [Vicugna pacos]XP_031540853.1 sulfate anion transporter 1 [Vicugna pacos]
MDVSPECTPQATGPVLVRRRPPAPPGLGEALKARLRRSCVCSVQGAWALLQDLFPATRWLRQYRPREDLAGDTMSGLVIGIILVPQAIAYSLLAGLPPVYSLYTSFFANLIYFLMGTSRHVSVGIFSLLCLMVGQVVDRELLLAGFDPAQDGLGPGANSSALNASAATLVLGLQDCGRDCYAIRVATALTLVAGIYQVLMGILRLGFVSTYLSQPLLDGFAMGASVTILTSQLRHLLGVRVPRHQGPGMVVSTWLSLLRSAGQANLCDVLTSATCLAVLLAAKELSDRLRHRLRVPLPAELLVIVVATLVSHFGQFHERFGSNVAGDIPTGFVAPRVPDPELMWRVAQDAVSLALIGSAFSISLAEMFARSHGYSVRANQELLAVGCCNVLPAFFHCFATSAALSKSLVKTATGCRTQVSSVVSAAVVLLVLLVLAPLFRDLQRCVLACVIVVSLRGALRKVRDVPRLWRLSPADALVWVATAATCVLVSTEAGLLAGVLLSLLSLASRTQRPRAALLARVGDSGFYEDSTEFEGLVPEPGVQVFRFSGPLYYANKDFFLRSLYSLTGLDVGHVTARRKEQGSGVGAGKGDLVQGRDLGPVSSTAALVPSATGFHVVVIDCAPLLFLDVAGLATLQDLRRDYEALGITLLLACCSPSVRDTLRRGGFLGEDQEDVAEEEQLFPSVYGAVQAARARHRELAATDSSL